MAEVKPDETKENADNINKVTALKSGIAGSDIKGVPEFKGAPNKKREVTVNYKSYMVDRDFEWSQMGIKHLWKVGRVFSEQHYNLQRLLNLGLKCHEIAAVKPNESDKYGY